MGVIPSPNIWDHPELYELENLAFDPDGLVEHAMREVADWAGRDVLDIGCGSGFHLPRFAETARTVTGVEPHPPLAALARRRTRGLRSVTVHQGAAEALPVPPASLDVAHARWAYFFGPGCEPGLGELGRVLRRGGVAFVVDNDGTRSTFGRWFRLGYPSVDPDVVERSGRVRGGRAPQYSPSGGSGTGPPWRPWSASSSTRPPRGGSWRSTRGAPWTMP